MKPGSPPSIEIRARSDLILSRTDRVVRSALWATFGDALGFISEGADKRGLARRLNGRAFDTVNWQRRLGYGKPEVTLPSGTYSDDTQLRLATGRSVDEKGVFNPRQFCKIELPLWISYALGAGRGSLYSARLLASNSGNWISLVAADKNDRYTGGGGNGSAMRIHPFAWMNCSKSQTISNTLVNTATTHGHPKAFVGSLFHVFCVKEAIQTGRVPSFEWGSEAVEDLKNMHGDFPIEFGDGWQEAWSRASGQLFRKTWADACNEIKDTLQALKKIKLQKNREHAYHEALLEANLFSNEERGSASKSAAISLLASMLFQDDGCKNALLAVCGQLGSDTDTIGSMTGAILGSVCVEKPSSDLQDRDYITAEAIRISELPNYRERRMNTFVYDEKESSASASKIVWRGATPLLEGLGIATAIETDRSMVRTNNEKDSYRWYVLSFGQTLLLKAAEQREETNPNLLLLETPQQAAANQRGVVDIDAVVESIELAKFDAKTIGDTILSLSSVENAPAIAGAFSYELVKRLLVKTSRLSRQEASTKRSTESRPVLQLQMQTVISADRLVLEGYISNYGKAPAVNVRIQFGFDRIPVASFLTLQVGEKRELSLKATMPIKSGMRVVVHFDRGDEHFRQDGLFEEALGSPATLLMKGLGDLQELSTARY